MSPIPAFEIGVWNAWIFMFYHFVPPALLTLIYRGTFKKISGAVPYSKTEKKMSILVERISALALIYSIFLPLKLGTIWFYIGLPVCLIGIIMHTIASVNFATTPLDQPITKGLYRYSRHPMYLAFFVISIGVSIASASWIFLLFSVVFAILSFILAIPEERFCLGKYSDIYREYMNRTPRWLGIPKPMK
jgi:protein-S-isoprenylcysteine O-methyltransferase Ste14